MVAILAAVSVSCEREAAGEGKEKSNRESGENGKSGTAARLVKEVTNLAGGAHVRLVWVDQRTRKELDPFGDQTNYRLVGFDNREKGFRVISTRRQNYSRPLMTPDGSAVIFTDRHPSSTQKSKAGAATQQAGETSGTEEPSALIHLIPWKRGHARVLGEGVAVAVWRDPATATDWVYGIDGHISKRASRRTHQTVFRFPIDEPARREIAWEGSSMSIDNFHISRDGRVFAALFPWPNAGIGEFQLQRWRKLDNGCWPALAPDNSRLAWVFDGAHKRIRLFDADGQRMGLLDLSAAPGMRNQAAFHPRWTNHPQFIVMTGPYPSEDRGREGIEAGARHAEVHLGKLKADLSGFDGWVRLTSNSAGDFYPDGWIDTGSAATLERFPQHVDESIGEKPVAAWPRVNRGVAFLWENSKSANQIDGRGTACTFTARSRARPGMFFDLLFDGGWFEADADSADAWTGAVEKSGEFSVQIVVTEEGSGSLPDEGVALFRCQNSAGGNALELRRTPRGLRVELRLDPPEGGPPSRWRDDLATDQLNGGRACVIGLNWQGQRLEWFIDGTSVRHGGPTAPGSLKLDPESTLIFGDPSAAWPQRWWRAEKIILAGAARTADEFAAESRAARAGLDGRSRPTPSRVKVRVIDATAPEPGRLDVYKRMLVDQTCEVIEIIDGPAIPAKKIVVLHWGILDEKPVPGIPRKKGSIVELVLDPADAHPELESELTVTSDLDFNLPAFYDIAPPDRP